MTKRADIITAVTAASKGVTEASTHGNEALETAQELTQQAAEHGWDGVAATMQEAVDALERSVQQLETTETACEAALTKLDEITDKMSSPEVVEHLDAAIAELESGAGALENVGSEIDEATEASQRAGEPEALLQSLLALREETDQVHAQVRETADATKAEREEAATYGN